MNNRWKNRLWYYNYLVCDIVVNYKLKTYDSSYYIVNIMLRTWKSNENDNIVRAHKVLIQNTISYINY